MDMELAMDGSSIPAFPNFYAGAGLLSNSGVVRTEWETSNPLQRVVRIKAPRIPAWLARLRHQFEELSKLATNWDQHNALPISPRAIVNTLQLLNSFMAEESALPSVVPTKTGCVQLEWHRNGADLELEVGDDPHTLNVFFAADQEEFEAVVNISDMTLSPFLNRVL